MLGSLNLSMGRQGGSPEGSIVDELRFLVQQGSATGMKICQTNLFYESHLMETALIAAIHFTLVTDALLTVLDVLCATKRVIGQSRYVAAPNQNGNCSKCHTWLLKPCF